MCLDFHPVHNSLLAVGCHDGTVMVFDVRHKANRPIYSSSIKTGKHTDPVWQVRALVVFLPAKLVKQPNCRVLPTRKILCHKNFFVKLKAIPHHRRHRSFALNTTSMWTLLCLSHVQDLPLLYRIPFNSVRFCLKIPRTPKVYWQSDDQPKELNFFSISSDGRVASWVMSKNELKMEPVMQLKLVSTIKASVFPETHGLF